MMQLFKQKIVGKEVEKEEIKFQVISEQKIAQIPEIDDKTKVDLRYGLIIPYAYVHIYWDEGHGELVYYLEEPSLDDKEKETLNVLEEGIREFINMSFINVSEKGTLIEYLEKNVRVLLKELGIKLDKNSYLKIMYYIYRDFIGLNRIEPLMNDYYIEDIECNGRNTPVYIVHRKFGNLRTNIIYEDFDELKDFVAKLSQKCGRYISYGSPMVDGQLPSGDRVNATYTEDVTSRGPTFTLRKFTRVPWSPIKLMEMGTVSAELLAYLWLLIEHGSNILIVGGTGSGKCVIGDTSVHLSNGEVKKIRDIVEMEFEKKRVFENGMWEYVDGDGLKILSLDKDTLKIIDAPIGKFWRHKAPNKLYKVFTRSGRIITTTPEHPFFSFENGSLVNIRADKLNKSDRIAVPRNISVKLGKKSYALINRLLEEREIYAYGISDIVKESFQRLKEEYNLTETELAKQFGINRGTFYSWKRENAIPLNILNKLTLKAGLKLDDKIKLKGKTSSRTIRLPSLNKDLFRFIGLVLGDGHLTNRYIEFHNSNKDLLNDFLELGFKLFGIKAQIECPKNRVTKARIGSVVAARLLNKVFQIPYGEKASRIVVPTLLFEQDEGCIGFFLSGVLDCEVHISNIDLDIGMKSYNFLRQLSTLLLRLGVISRCSGGSRPRLVISGLNNIKNLRSFIELRNQNKIDSLNKLLNRNINRVISNVDLIPNVSNWIKFIRQENKMTQNELAISSGISRRLVGMWESGFRLPSIHTFRSFAENIDVPMVKTIADSDIFWDEIIKIELLENHGERYVYDLTVPGHHNFLAGDIPIIIHNTTLLNNIAFFIPDQARIVSIEDTREIQLIHENWLPSVARAGVGLGEGGVKPGEVTMFDLLKGSFRQRPDYVIVGEVRGAEASVLMQGAAAGHPSISTMHADDVATVIRRLMTPPISLSPALIESLDAAVLIGHATIRGKDVRKVKAVEEIIKIAADGRAELNVPFRWDPRSNTFQFKRESYVFEKIMRKKGISREELNREFDLRTKLLLKMYQEKITEFEEVQKVIHSYYKVPYQVLLRFGLK